MRHQTSSSLLHGLLLFCQPLPRGGGEDARRASLLKPNCWQRRTPLSPIQVSQLQWCPRVEMTVGVNAFEKLFHEASRDIC